MTAGRAGRIAACATAAVAGLTVGYTAAAGVGVLCAVIAVCLGLLLTRRARPGL